RGRSGRVFCRTFPSVGASEQAFLSVVGPRIARMFERVDRAVVAFNAAHASLLARVAVVDEAESWRNEGAMSLSAWLRGRYGLTKATAVEWVRVARALRSLPAIAAA